MTSRDTQRTRELNDTFRTTGPAELGTWVVTHGVQSQGREFVATAVGQVRAFDTFTRDNDPHGEHDFGRFQVNDETLYWKIDYYDATRQYGSENPADPEVTHRVLTIMLASEY